MKIKVIKNRRFKLTPEDTIYVIDTYIRPAFPDHSFEVRKSQTSNSIYIDITYFDAKKKIRLSDHPNTKVQLTYHYVSPNTRIQKIIAIFVNSINQMHNKILDDILDDL